MKNLVVIKNDVFNISKRLKSIDKNYIVVRNISNKCFEVHYKKVGNLQLKVPYNNLDARTIKLVLKTKTNDIKSVFEYVDEYNENVLKDKITKSVESFCT